MLGHPVFLEVPLCANVVAEIAGEPHTIVLRDDVLFEIAGRRRLVIAVLAGETLARLFGQFVTLKVDRICGPVVAGVARVADTLVLRLLVLFQIVIRCAQVVTQIAGVTKPLVLGQNMLFQHFLCNRPKKGRESKKIRQNLSSIHVTDETVTS